ncbi:hypothetical protein K443DRAFT_677867 [Laccaria amethystina LaAM-08-1]|uniref:Uncharacterized protein n=1 Tax=Laccaria amethystina LaAM-08-1 TaxID=1095629 RepID=A0A0C9XKR2_9AGAR|nr:hypothetical protein K443DRAFT_677867 [Laccaria amethystina LaAM-08-1]
MQRRLGWVFLAERCRCVFRRRGDPNKGQNNADFPKVTSQRSKDVKACRYVAAAGPRITPVNHDS